MTWTTIEIDALYPDGEPCAGREVSYRLVDGGAGGSTGDDVISDARTVRLDSAGHAEIDMIPNAELTPAGTFYRLSMVGSVSNLVRSIEVPVSATPISWADNAIQVASPVPPTFTGVIPADDIAVDLTDYAGIGVTADNVQDGFDQAFQAMVALASGTGTGTESDLAKHATIQATARIERAVHFVLTQQAAQTVTAAERQAAGLTAYPYWPDGGIGFWTDSGSGTTYGFAANSANSARWVATPSELLGTVIANNIELTTVEPADYAAGGTVYDIGGGKIIKLIHYEDHLDGNPSVFMSSAGLAVASTSAPDTWTDLGKIVTATVGDTAADAWHDLAGGNMVVFGSYVYVFFSERTSNRRGAFAVARATLSSVVTWAGGGAAAVFYKWHEGAWTELGLGGDSTEIIVGAPYPAWSACIRMSGLADRFIMVWTSKLTSESDAGNRWGLYACISEPGSVTEWGEVEQLIAPQTATRLTYVTLADASSLNTHVSDAATVKLYLGSSVEGTLTGGFVWDDAEVLVYDLTCYLGWTTLALTNSWVAPVDPVRFRRTAPHMVEVDVPVIVGGASGSVAFTLPPGGRPAEYDKYGGYCTLDATVNGVASLVVNTDGTVQVSFFDAAKPAVGARFFIHTDN